MQGRSTWFLLGLFLTTVSTLLVELLNTRLLSVITWYHLSFFAVSTAMFGMSAGAIRVYLGGSMFEGPEAARQLARNATLFALSIPSAHVVVLSIPVHMEQGANSIASLAVMTVTMAVPFYLSGVVVAIALTRIPGPTGLIYAVDLIGAALGSLMVLPVLNSLDVSSATLFAGAVAAAAAVLFHRMSGSSRTLPLAAGVLCLLAAAQWNHVSPNGLRVGYAKDRVIQREDVHSEFWSLHGRVVIHKKIMDAPWYWGKGAGSPTKKVAIYPMDIDGMAGTSMTEWNGKPEALGWVQYDVASLPYHLRQGGKVAVIGVGGGRDVLTALWAKSESITGIEINKAFLHSISGPFREFAGVADRPEVRLIHDEARSYLSRTLDRYDVIQMSLIDTWASTGAGAFTLTENGLYTLEGWRVFFRALQPTGIFGVSRWYSAGAASETSRLLVLATASLLDRGVQDAAAHTMLIARHNVATLLVSPRPFPPKDLATLRRAAKRYQFRILVAPGIEPADDLLGQIVSSRSIPELSAVVATQPYDYSIPTDQRPYFFNILKPKDFLMGDLPADYRGVHAEGNLLASRTLTWLWIISAVLVLTVIVGPLVRAGLPDLDADEFSFAVAYFAIIGLGFMLVQIPLIQRFSVYLGHPTYSLAVILFSMILAAGLGSWLSDRLPVESGRRYVVGIPLGIATILLATVLSLQWIIDATIHLSLFHRCAVVVAVVSTVALPLGLCFPIGLRLVRQLSEDAMPWMWGVNGASSVLATVSAVWISMWSGIHASLFIATGLYALLAVPAIGLWSRGRRD